uniref:Odorant receptor n=1 Tax=Bradysia odoriphaga TaxID=1564500 RepID=A0A6B9CEP0_9DIPT|nr:odorant receptor 29 [Bradysia odoriphaga]
MSHLEWDPTLRRFIEFLYAIGIWSKDGESKSWMELKRILFFLQYFSFVVYLFIGGRQAYKNGDMAQLVFLSENQIACIVVLMKLAYLLWRKDEMTTFLYDDNVTHCNANREESAIVNGNNRKIAIFNKVYTTAIMVGITFMLVISSPAFTNDDKMLPVFIHFDLDCYYDSVLYWIVYVDAFLGTFFCGIYTFTMLIIWYIMYNYSLEYKLLGRRLTLLGTETPNTYRQDLIHSIDGHNNLFQSVEKFRSTFDKLFFVEMFVGAAFICTSVYNLSYNTPDNLFEIVIYAVMFCYAFFEIFLLMYFANEITLNSNQMSYCLFESKWIEQSESTKKCVIIFGEIIRIPQVMTVYIYPMNLEKFMSIANCAYSMFNILQSFK